MTTPPLDESRPFLRKAGLAAGITRYRIDGPDFQRIHGTVRVRAGTTLTPLLRARAARLVVPGAWASHHTAARIWKGVVPDTELTHVGVPSPGERRSRPGLECHVGRGATVRMVEDVPVACPAQTFLDMATSLDLVDLVVLGDSLVHGRVTSVDELRNRADGYAGPCSGRVREAAELVVAGAESGMETRSRLLLTFAGFPHPEVNTWVLDDDRTPRYRLDLPYPVLKLAFEYEGRQHAEDPGQYAWDIARREWLEGRGWRLMLLRAQDIYVTPWQTALRAQAAFAQRGFRIDLPRVPPERFRLHFPGQPWRKAG